MAKYLRVYSQINTIWQGSHNLHLFFGLPKQKNKCKWPHLLLFDLWLVSCDNHLCDIIWLVWYILLYLTCMILLLFDLRFMSKCITKIASYLCKNKQYNKQKPSQLNRKLAKSQPKKGLFVELLKVQSSKGREYLWRIYIDGGRWHGKW